MLLIVSFARFGMANGPAARIIGVVLITFFCTRCGAHLETEAEHSNGRVRCEHCTAITRVPHRADDGIPFARVVAVADASPTSSDAAAGLPGPEVAALSYVPAWPERLQQSVMVDLFAERLKHVHADDEPEGGDGDTAECR